MVRYKKIMVALNLDDADTMLIRYAGFISKMAKSSDVYFVHVSNTFEIPEEIKKVFPQILSPVDLAAKDRMKEEVEQHFNGHKDAKLWFESLEGQVLGNLIACTKNHEIDLVITGHYINKAPSGQCLSEKLARKAFCSVLIVPENSKIRFDDILVAVDFSEHSLVTLDVGTAFAKAARQPYIDIINTYYVPEGYYKTGKSFEEFAHIMEKNAYERLEQLLEKSDLKGIDTKAAFRLNSDVVDGILKYSDEVDAHLIVVGARGRSGDIAAILLGSITEGLIRKLHRPLLAVKEKGKGLNILEALSLQ